MLLQPSRPIATWIIAGIAAVAGIVPLRTYLERHAQGVRPSQPAPPAKPTARGEQSRPPAADNWPMTRPQQTLGPWDILFRVLTGLGVLEIIALVVSMATHPDGTGLAGQGLILRAWLGLMVGPMMLLFGVLIVLPLPRDV